MSITQRALTTGEVEGSGIFDELMRTVKAHIKQELDEGRINELNYSQVYLSALQNTLSAALQFTLQYELANKQLEVLDEQIIAAQKQNELLDLQKAKLSTDNSIAQYNLQNMLPKQLDMLIKQAAQVTAQTTLTEAQVNKVTAEILVVGKQEDLVDEQIKTQKANTVTPTGGLLKAQYDKTQSEVAVLNQKKITEQKQTTGTYSDTGGLVGAEMKLKDKQASSFDRDAEQKAVKVFGDQAAVLASIESVGFDMTAWGFSPDSSEIAVSKLLSGLPS